MLRTCSARTEELVHGVVPKLQVSAREWLELLADTKWVLVELLAGRRQTQTQKRGSSRNEGARLRSSWISATGGS